MSEFEITEYVELLRKLVGFETTFGSYCEFEKATDFLKEYCAQNGLYIKEHANYLTVEFSNKEPELVFFTHLDVVSTSGQSWSNPPYDLSEAGGKLYGRGVLDDKGPMAAILLLMKNMKEKVNYNVRLFIGFCEETTFDCIKDYNRIYDNPKLGIVSDAKFPVIYGEKGSANFTMRLPKKVEVIDTCNATNTVPSKFITEYCEYLGEANHSSKSNLETNPIYMFLKETYSDIFNDTIKFEQNPLGKTIYNPTMVKSLNDYIEVYFDVRYCEKKDLQTIADYFRVNINDSKPAKNEYDDNVVKKLMTCYQNVTGDYDSLARTSSAGTYSSYLANTYVFGFASPNEEGNVHIENENILISTIVVGYEIYKNLLLNLIEEEK